MAGFIPPHRQQQFLRACSAFLQWWLSELVHLLPRKWCASLLGQQTLYRLSLTAGRLDLVFAAQSQETTLGHCYLLSEGIAVSEIDTLAQTAARQELLANISALGNKPSGRIVLELADDYLLVRDITLPLVSAGDIASMLGHEIDRLSPFAKDQVCYSYEVLQKDLPNGKLRLRLMCLEKAVLEGLLEQCDDLGLSVCHVQSQTGLLATDTLRASRNLLPLDRRPAKEKLWSRANQMMAGLALVLLFTVFMLPLWHYENQIETLSTEVNALLEQSKAVRARQASLVNALDIRDALVARKNSEFEKIIILHNLVQVIPDNTWLTRVTVRDSVLEIEGESDKSSDLIEKLESEEAFYQVEFASSVTRNSRTAKERFQIKMRLSDKPEKGLANDVSLTHLSTEQAAVEVARDD